MAFRPFFPPSPEITNDLLVRMGQRRASVLREARMNFNEEVDEEPTESDELASSILAALENEPEQVAENDWEDQRWLSDIMYHFMGRMAGRARRNANTFMMTDAIIIDGMSTSLGLYESQDIPLLKELAEEFSLWLSAEPNKSYVAGWGKIVRNPYDQIIYLEPFSRDVSSAATEGNWPVAKSYREVAPLDRRSEARAANATDSREIRADRNLVKPRSQ